MLWDYCDIIMKTNPGSTMKMMCDSSIEGQTKFMRIYIYLDAFKKGFLSGCRPLLGLDGSFIKGYHKGQLLAAVGVDPNNGIYLIVYAVMESECHSTCKWFLEFLAQDLGIEQNSYIAWMSDRQKGLIEVVREIFGNVPYRFCL